MNTQTKRVLVVEDNVDAADLLAEALRAKGHEVLVAHSPLVALGLLSAFRPEVALLDLGLPDMDGFDLARRIIQSCADCRLIAVTGYGDEATRARAHETGFVAHLVKPVTAAVLLAAITDVS